MDNSSGGGGDGEGKATMMMEEKSKETLQEKGGGGEKGKSCKGYLYYTSTLKSKARNPRCIGLPRKLQQVPNYIVGQSEAEASKDGRALVDFYYACLGYSVYMTEKDSPAMKQGAKTQLPFCVGFELLADRKVASANTSSMPAHVHNKEDARQLPQTRPHRPIPSTAGDDFFNRFTRNSSVVASGVARNMRKVGNYVKETVDDILYPYRKRPK